MLNMGYRLSITIKIKPKAGSAASIHGAALPALPYPLYNSSIPTNTSFQEKTDYEEIYITDRPAHFGPDVYQCPDHR
jgi:hypothetical protein